jgi:hypothetical protein
MDISGFIFKVLVVSTLLSVAIKYGGPVLQIAETTPNVLVAVFLPTLVVATALGWRAWRQRYS